MNCSIYLSIYLIYLSVYLSGNYPQRFCHFMLVSCQMGLIIKSIKIRFYIYLEKTKILKVGIFAHSGLALALCVKIDHLFCLVSLKI